MTEVGIPSWCLYLQKVRDYNKYAHEWQNQKKKKKQIAFTED